MLLCKSARPELSEAIDAFMQHTESSNEVFWLAAKIYARLSIDVRNKNLSLKEALKPYRMFVKRYWWDVMDLEDEHDPEEYEIVLKAVLMESLDLLKAIFPFDELQPSK